VSRDRFGSRLGFILLSAGCAIGVGNVWKFPWMVGQYGGGAFVLVYLIFLVILGLPIMTMEFSLGRASQASPVKLYQKLEKPGQKWHVHGYASLVGLVVLMMFYTSVSGWMLYYFIGFLSGRMTNLSPEASASVFPNMMSNPLIMVGFMAIVVVAGFVIVSIGVQKGIERVSKYMMVALLGLIIVIAIYCMTLSGAKEGLKFYLMPDFTKINGNVIVGAMNQSFFTLSIGIGSMAIFGSYIGKERSLLGESVNILVLDTFVAFTAGLIIFPACYSFEGVEISAGPSLLFEAMAGVFNRMNGGRIWGTLFFLFMFFAAMTTIIAVAENIVACVCEITNWKRLKSSIICGIAVLILSLPCALGFNLWSKVVPFATGSSILDLEDFIVSNCLLPLGALCFVLFCTSKKGWGFDNYFEEVNTGKGLKVGKWIRPYVTYVLPLIIIFVFFVGILTFPFADNFTIWGWLRGLFA